MNPSRNPFAPGAGTQPPELAGREGLLEELGVTLDRMVLGRSTRSHIFYGLRGVGKTVLLNRAREMATERHFETFSIEAHEDAALPALLIPPMRRLLLRLDRQAGMSEAVKRGLRVLRSFLGKFHASMKVGDLADLELGLEPERGTADSGILEADLSDLFLAAGEAAKDRGAQICFLLDEMQYLTEEEFSGLIMALHQISQHNLPVLMVGAGLPQILALAGRSKSYAERLFAFTPVGALLSDEARVALQAPVREQQVEFTKAALAEIIAKTHGYPYFLQQWAYEAWNTAPGTPIGSDDVHRATAKALTQLDRSFFRVRFDRLTRREKDYLFAMLAVGGQQQRSGEIAEQLKIKTTSLGPLRSSLIRKGMIYSPSHGDNAFTGPLFNEFLERQLAQTALTVP